MEPRSDKLIRVARNRLYPSLRNPNYLVLRSRRLILSAGLDQLGKDLTVLDIGGRYQPYRPLIEGKIKKYVALDVLRTDFVNVVGSGENVPFKKNTFDLVIATGVFEYFRRPHEAAEQIHSVLKPGGSLFMSVASVAPRFVDEECWRYMPLALKSVLAPFSKVTIVPEVSSLGGVCRFMNLAFHDFLKLKPLKAAYEVLVCPPMNLLGLCLEAAKLTTNDQWTGNYSTIAVK